MESEEIDSILIQFISVSMARGLVLLHISKLRMK